MTNKSSYCIEFFYAKPDCFDQLKRALEKLVLICKKEVGCLQYELLADDANPNLLILIVQFETKDLMLIHEKQPHVQAFAENEMKRYCQTVKWYDARAI